MPLKPVIPAQAVHSRSAGNHAGTPEIVISGQKAATSGNNEFSFEFDAEHQYELDMLNSNLAERRTEITRPKHPEVNVRQPAVNVHIDGKTFRIDRN